MNICDICGEPLTLPADESANRHDPNVFQQRIERLQRMLEQARAGALTNEDVRRRCGQCDALDQAGGLEQLIMQRIADMAGWRAAEHI